TDPNPLPAPDSDAAVTVTEAKRGLAYRAGWFVATLKKRPHTRPFLLGSLVVLAGVCLLVVFRSGNPRQQTPLNTQNQPSLDRPIADASRPVEARSAKREPSKSPMPVTLSATPYAKPGVSAHSEPRSPVSAAKEDE